MQRLFLLRLLSYFGHYAEAIAEGMGGEGMDVKIQPNAAEILGYSCDKVEVMGGVTYLLHICNP